MSIIELNAVTKVIRKQTVLEDINLSLAKGKIIGFVGHNGSGKTMLFRVIAGLVKPSAGEVIVSDQILHKQISFPKSISVLLEKPAFLEQYSGFDNLKFLADIQKRIDDQQIRQVIESVGLNPDDKRSVKTYSLGMKQKLAIAQAIMEKPDIILLDEPMNGLDEDSVKNVYHLIKAENERGATVLLTSHHKKDIEELCHIVYKMNSGKIQTTD
ncbi:ABC transporter ATP-binding protein [Bacillus sp. FSL K6-4563]|uniref:ABC transporter ATP-binding protein n=1 Tax=Bacillus TaxID=1386 RepID=UPI00017A5DF0|nr:ABC transporter ATP-binding protein [Bacillus pumilus]EDW23523.1 copper transport ATP-binding protein NosF [Bacillus pumilus ATCC 7061]MCR4354518.1 ABC transporter ATP-binding protein [Bacillus pumilus]MCW4680754.1 ABC transporter ATP-binding protein [Bacillus pumilus]MCY7506861.1 ABC transporter ATP-binding protein [Bacillus pumilus]MDR4270672.1 ABC transporter ATP-binding protein [Bacillus pumilus]